MIILNRDFGKTTTVWLSDFKDFPGLAEHINIVLKCNYGRVIMVATNFMVIGYREEINLYDTRWVGTLPVA